jgi:hypothetical protein
MSKKTTGLIDKAILRVRAKKEASSTSPLDYVDKILKSDLPIPEKRKIGKNYRKTFGVTSAEVTAARNRHPYYKKLKNKNSKENQKNRNKIITATRRAWTKSDLELFARLNDTMSDIALARELDRTIPSVNAMRRKHKINSEQVK